MFRRLCSILSVVILSTFLLSPATAEQRGGKAVKKEAKQATAANTGYYALVIGNNNYKYMPKLKAAANDARSVEKMLREKYGFQTKLLLDATRTDIIDSINEMRKKLGEKDSFLIYYAGHGEFDKTVDKAYWLPVDSKRDSDSNWIIADEITSNIKRISSKHILIVSDSCYSGTLTRAAVVDMGKTGERAEYLKKMTERSSRTLMASGGNEPVSDSGGGDNSIFAAAFLTALKEADKSVFSAEELFHGRVKSIVAGKSEQVPEYAELRNSGHAGGDFVFQLAKATPSMPTAVEVEATSVGAIPQPDVKKKPATGFSLDDFESKMKAEEERKKSEKDSWHAKTEEMKVAFNKIAEYEQKDVDAELKAKAWQYFSEKFTEENPYGEDKEMRAQAKKKSEHWLEMAKLPGGDTLAKNIDMFNELLDGIWKTLSGSLTNFHNLQVVMISPSDPAKNIGFYEGEVVGNKFSYSGDNKFIYYAKMRDNQQREAWIKTELTVVKTTGTTSLQMVYLDPSPFTGEQIQNTVWTRSKGQKK